MIRLPSLVQAIRGRATAGPQHGLRRASLSGLYRRMDRRQFMSLGAAGLSAIATYQYLRPSLAAASSESDFNLATFRTISLRTAKGCVSAAGDWVRPGGPYQEMYTRDTFWIVMSLRDTDLSTRIYRRFAEAQFPDGQIPSLLSKDGRKERKEDESTLLFVLWAYQLWKAGVKLMSDPVYKAWKWVEQHNHTGRYVTSAGTFHYWLDCLTFGTADTISYNQGLYAVAARCANLMGVETSTAKVTAAEEQYRACYKAEAGTVVLSQKSNLIDVSCLVGEYMAYHLTGKPVLTDDQVRSTLESFTMAIYPEGDFLGYLVCCHPGGEYLNPSWLPESTDNLPGEYQNGASWLLYDAMALAAGALHGEPMARGLLMARMKSELRTERYLHEYLSTNPVSPHYGVGPAYRRDYGWNSFVYLIGERVGLVDEEPILL